ncbi:receptor-like protein EIX1 [Elaeis guineensis]|uniref:receptor-like protein EIX1 n=1 Tax=Elaeis guineensis var. tenera TaxID=51953 RepID=UPI003C6D5883
MQPLMVYPFHFNFFKLTSGLPLKAGGGWGCNKRSLINERVMLIGFLLCMGVIPCYLCLDGRGGSKVGGSCIQNERKALLAIGADIYDPGEWLSSWTGQDCCQWRGVGCDNTSGHVVKLDLKYPYGFHDYGYGFYGAPVYETGKFPQPSKVNPSISSLIYLRYLDLSMNNFSGVPIPEFIGSLMHLEYLNLSNACFGGPIPRQIGNLSSLHHLSLQANAFFYDERHWNFEACPIALHADDLQWLSQISSLRYLDLSAVDLSKASNWLHEINMHPSLLVLKLSGTGLPGIPSTLQHVNFTSLTMLDLSFNDFQSVIVPHWVLNISSLVQLDLSSCNIHGRLSVAADMLGNLNRLKYLDFSGNQITGDISQSLWNNKHMEFLDLSGNNIIGHTQQMLGNLSQLRHFSLSGNQISGEIPESLGNLSHLEYLCLSYNRISGEIQKSMGNLLNLEELDLSSNQMTGSIPEEILGNHSQLRRLSLGSNQISGEIPKNLRGPSHLKSLDLSYNRISGEIPETIGNLLNLETLYLSDNTITGQIPRNMSNLCNLQWLDLSNNNFAGEITSLIEGFSECINNNKLDGGSILKSLILMVMNNNNFTGTIPESLGQLSMLADLDLSSNFFVGYLTEEHFSNLTKLDHLYLSYNTLKLNLSDGWIPSFNATDIAMCSCHVGPKFPAWLRTQTHLQSLCLSEAGISDKIPSWLWYRDMVYLNVSHNCMEGPIPSSLGSRTYELLDLSSNCFFGPVPNLKADYMILSNNSFSGPIPSSFSDEYMEPILLSLSHNHINGSIPHFLCNLTSLEVLDLSNNELIGGFPNCWSNSQPGNHDVLKNRRIKDTNSTVAYPMNLQSLHVRNNSLSGKFPSFLRLCKQLVVLDLGENRFSGNIPTWIGQSLSSLRVLRLRSNFFDSNIPMQISGLSSLQVLDLACNNFSGNLPSSFGNFTAMAELQEGRKQMLSDNDTASYYQESVLISAKRLELDYTTVLLLVTSIDLSQNNLFGEIPNEVTNLHGLYFLNLSGNHFIGKIPQNIGDMRQLESLDLSMNDLSGQIPQTMLALNYLSLLNLSHNNLSGRIPSKNQFQTFNDPSIYIGNHDLCGQPLPDCPANAPPHQEDDPHQEDEEVDRDNHDIIWICASSALGFILGFWSFVGTLMIKKDIRISYLRFIDRTYDWVYKELAIKFAMLKFVIGKSNHKHN